MKFWQSHCMCAEFMDSVLICFWGGNVVGWMNRSLGGLGENIRDILKIKRKKKRKKGKHLFWFNYELCLVVRDGEWQRALLEYVY